MLRPKVETPRPDWQTPRPPSGLRRSPSNSLRVGSSWTLCPGIWPGKNSPRFLSIFWLILDRSGDAFFVNFASKLDCRGTQKHWTTYCLYVLLLFLQTCQQEGIWFIFWPTWRQLGHQNLPKNRPEMFPNSVKNGIKNMKMTWDASDTGPEVTLSKILPSEKRNDLIRNFG